MTNAEMYLNWLINHRGEPETAEWMNRMAGLKDADVVESCREAIRIEFEPEDAEIMGMVIERLDRKYKHNVRRIRKDADNKEHLRKIALKRMKKGA